MYVWISCLIKSGHIISSVHQYWISHIQCMIHVQPSVIGTTLSLPNKRCRDSHRLLYRWSRNRFFDKKKHAIYIGHWNLKLRLCTKRTEHSVELFSIFIQTHTLHSKPSIHFQYVEELGYLDEKNTVGTQQEQLQLKFTIKNRAWHSHHLIKGDRGVFINVDF